MILRTCKKCAQEKPIDEFVKNKHCIDGRTHRCNSCLNEAQRCRKPRDQKPRKVIEDLLADGKKRCPGCDTIKPITEYHRGTATRWGKHGIASRCKACASLSNQAYRRDHKERLEEYNKKYREREDIAARRLTGRRRRSAASPRHVMQITLRHGLNRKPTEFPATVDDLMVKFETQGGKCAVSGIALTWAQGRILPTSLSLDRINSEDGYSKENIRLVCQAVNAFKGRMSDAEMLVMAKAIVTGLEQAQLGPSWEGYSDCQNESDYMVLH